MNLYYDQERDITFRIGDIVHWYKYSSDMIIMDGGYGLLVDVKLTRFKFGQHSILCSILVNGGTIEEFSPRDLDTAEDWSEDE